MPPQPVPRPNFLSPGRREFAKFVRRPEEIIPYKGVKISLRPGNNLLGVSATMAAGELAVKVINSTKNNAPRRDKHLNHGPINRQHILPVG